jgi:hypothetical protein
MFIKLLLYLYSFICCFVGVVSIKGSFMELFGKNIYTGILAIIFLGIIPLAGGLFLLFKILKNSDNYSTNQLVKIFLGSLLFGISSFAFLIIISAMIRNYNYTLLIFLIVFGILPSLYGIKLFNRVIENRKSISKKS